MHDVVIIGGGLCGLAIAHNLQARRVDWALFEARERLGGRILTQRDAQGRAMDLGPTWYWPSTQPSMHKVVEDLGLASVAQPDDGQVLLLDDANRPPRLTVFDARQGRLLETDQAQAVPGSLHGGARRLTDGMMRLCETFAHPLPAASVHTGHVLHRVTQSSDGAGVTLQMLHAGELVTVRARQVVLAIPPRLLAQDVVFDPPLPTDVAAALVVTPTWMATAAKAAVACEKPVWKALGQSGNAWVTHAQAVLAESFDSGTDAAPALAGFVAIAASRRPPFRAAMPILLETQVNMLYTPAAAPGETWVQDWAEEPFTCSRQDLAEDGQVHPVYGNPLLQAPLWNEQLWLAGSETASRGGGYLEGALNAAGRVLKGLA